MPTASSMIIKSWYNQNKRYYDTFYVYFIFYLEYLYEKGENLPPPGILSVGCNLLFSIIFIPTTQLRGRMISWAPCTRAWLSGVPNKTLIIFLYFCSQPGSLHKLLNLNTPSHIRIDYLAQSCSIFNINIHYMPRSLNPGYLLQYSQSCPFDF